MTKEDAEALVKRYSTRTSPNDNGTGRMSYLNVEILLDGEPVGSYERNYSSLFDSFQPFVQEDGQGGHHVLALYSRFYTATRLMRLPECVDLGGEDSATGFCPTAFLVPFDPKRGLTGHFGFLSGCFWGDDSSWKIRYLDLSEAANGILRHEDRFGYLELPRHIELRDAVNFESYRGDDEFGSLEFTVGRTFELKKGRFERDDKGNYIDDDEEERDTGDSGAHPGASSTST